MLCRLFFVWFLMPCLAFAAIKSSESPMQFDVGNDGSTELTLSPQGLGVFETSPSSNLHLQGSMAWGLQKFSSDGNITASMIVADSSSDNLTLTLP